MKLHALALLYLSLSACSQGPSSSPGSKVTTASTPAVGGGPTTSSSTARPSTNAAPSCAANPSWVTSPSFPSEVPGGGQTLCAFQQLAWQDFLALVQPVAGSSDLVFETWMTKAGVFQPDAYEPGRKVPFAWGASLPIPKSCVTPGGKPKKSRTMGLIRQGVGGFANEQQQAGSNTAPLVDQKGNWVFYEQLFNKTEYDYLTGCGLFTQSCFDSLGTSPPFGPQGPSPINFPAQSIELKTSWRVLDPQDTAAKARYYTVEAFVQPTAPDKPGCTTQTLGLVGFHIVHKTPDHPESIWATFAHEDNAPECAAPAAKSPTGQAWAFYDPSCNTTSCPPNLFRNACGKETCAPCSGSGPGTSCVSTFSCGGDLQQTCQTVGTCPSPTRTSSSNPANNCSYCYDATCTKKSVPTQACRDFPTGFGGKGSIDPSIKLLNTAVHALPGLASVWQHYQLIGTVWFGPPSPLPVKIAYDPTTGKATNSLEGSTELSNVTMETFNQGLAGSCFACHNGSFASHSAAFPQADFSHLFAGMSIAGAGACKVNPSYPGACPKPGAAKAK